MNWFHRPFAALIRDAKDAEDFFLFLFAEKGEKKYTQSVYGGLKCKYAAEAMMVSFAGISAANKKNSL
jgi:hypothetical protein